MQIEPGIDWRLVYLGLLDPQTAMEWLLVRLSLVGSDKAREDRMSVSVEWEIKATEFANCNCIYACPCQFNALPDKGFCEAVAVIRSTRGTSAMSGWTVCAPPRCGTGRARCMRATAACNSSSMSAPMHRQRDALVKILSGQETEDMATVWWVFSAMSPNKHPPLFQPITFDVDVDARRARLDVPGMVHLDGRADP